MCFEVFASVINLLRGTAIDTLAILPSMQDFIKVDIAVGIIEMREAVFTAGVLRAIEATATHQRSQPGDGNTIELMVHDMIDTLLKIRNLVG